MRIYLVGCAKSKLSRPAEARVLYTSQLFRLSKEYVEASLRDEDAWYILSAGHGLCSPHKVLEPYDMRLSGRMAEREAWAAGVFWQLDITFKEQGDVTFVILAGKSYAHPLAEKLRDAGYGVETPLEGLGIGKRMSWLKAIPASLPA